MGEKYDIEKALRDEGTSYHYLPPTDFSPIKPDIYNIVAEVLAQSPLPLNPGATWTTCAPFREPPHPSITFVPWEYWQ